MLEEVGVARVGTMLREVVDLAIQHERPAEGGNRDNGPDGSLPHGEDKPGPHEEAPNVKGAA